MTPSWPLAPFPVTAQLAAQEIMRRLRGEEVWDLVGLDPRDEQDARTWAGNLRQDDAEQLAQFSPKVLSLLGSRFGAQPTTFFSSLHSSSNYPENLLALLLLTACAPEVKTFGVSQGFSSAVASSGLADLGHQARVHRNNTGSFGLRTAWWLSLPWNGSLWWFGRLQYNLIKFEGRYWLSTHIPQTGPLIDVDDSFTQAKSFAKANLASFEIAGFHLNSWLLDPHLSTELGSKSNTTQFARRWTLVGEAREATSEALTFTFGVGPDTPTSALPQNTSMERVVASRVIAGQSWTSPTGLIQWAN